VLPDAEDSNWDYDEVAGKWFLHRFYWHMPDLNIANPRVREEISKVVGLLAGAGPFRLPGRRRPVRDRAGRHRPRPERGPAALRELLNLPGTPVLLYGEEIGLGDDQRVEGRAAARVAMQWAAGPNAGFTTGEPAVPLVTDGPFAPGKVNVADQRRDPSRC